MLPRAEHRFWKPTQPADLDLTFLKLGFLICQKRACWLLHEAECKISGSWLLFKNMVFPCPHEGDESDSDPWRWVESDRHREGGEASQPAPQPRRPSSRDSGQHRAQWVSTCLQILAPLLTSQVIVSKSLTSWCLNFLICEMETLIETPCNRETPVFWGYED